MEERKTIFNYLIEVFCVFGIAVVIMIVFCRIFGDDARELSSMFRLGKEGLPVDTMLQFLAISFLTEGLQYVFFSGRWLKKWTALAKYSVFFLAIVAVVSAFICLFGWFPVGMWQPWVLFLMCFLINFGISIVLMRWKTRLENKKLEEGLNRMREKWEEEENEQRK